MQRFFWIVVSVADAALVNPEGTKTLLTKGISLLFINGKPTFTKRPRKFSNVPFWQVIFVRSN